MLECEGKRREGMRCRNGDTRLLLSNWSRSLLVAKDGSYRRHQTDKAMSMQVRNHGAKGHDNRIPGHGSQLYLSKNSSWMLFNTKLDFGEPLVFSLQDRTRDSICTVGHMSKMHTLIFLQHYVPHLRSVVLTSHFLGMLSYTAATRCILNTAD